MSSNVTTSEHITHGVRLVLLFVWLGVSVAGTFGTQYTSDDGNTSLYLYQVDIGGTKTKTADYPFACDDQKHMLTASFALGIIGFSSVAICLIMAFPPFFG